MDRKRSDCWNALVAVAFCAVVLSGCAQFRLPRIDPTGQRLFATGPVPEPGPQQPWEPVDLIVTPRVTVAPVGSEVVLVAGVCGQDRYLVTNERVEWTLDQGGVGEFVDLGKGTWGDLLLGDFTKPKKTDATHAVGSTARADIWLTRGTPVTTDDVCVRSGQTWISVTSPAEGTSYVTAFAPEVYGWEQRKQTAMIHWIDAQWRFPPPAINPAGTRHVFTTTVMRQTDQAPCRGWRVRYQIVDGPPAGFAPTGARVVEVETDPTGQASAEIFQQQAAPGTNRIEIQITRPATAGSRQIVIGTGVTSKTWSAAGIGLRKIGPATASVGSTVSYRIQVSNPGDVPAQDVTVVDEIPDLMSYVSSNPPADLTGRALRWRLGSLGAGACRAMEVTLRADRPGSATSCAEATAAGGLKARECLTTTVGTAALDLRVTGPDRANVGAEVTFEIVIANPGDATYSDLVLTDTFDAGLEHAQAKDAIRRKLHPLGPRQSVRITVTFRVAKAGQLCHTVEVVNNNVVAARARVCVAAAAGPVTPPVTPPLTQPAVPPSTPPITPPVTTPSQTTPPTGPAAVSVKMSGPALRTVNETAEFSFDVTNTGSQTLTGLKVLNEAPKELESALATSGYQLQGNNLVWTIDTLLPGRTNRYQAHYQCVQASPRACNRVRVTTQQGAQGEDQVWLEIRPAPAAPSGGLTMNVVGLHNPIGQGKELTYEVRVVNNGQTPDGNLALEVTVPPQMVPVRLQTTGPDGLGFDIDGQTIRFNPARTLGVGQSLAYRIRVRTREAGEVLVRARLTSQNLRQPLVAEEKTQILPQR